MACGRPTICTDVASLPEVVVHGETGYVVPAANPQALATAIATLQANPGEAERLGANGRSRVLDRFRWENVVDRCISAYLEM
jgi:glycosyltransferase involved in cell wall biosynthesis